MARLFSGGSFVGKIRLWLEDHRNVRAWLSAIGTVFLPLVVAMSGIGGAGYISALCLIVALWTVLWFWPEISRITFSEESSTVRSRPPWLILPGLASVFAVLLGWTIFYHSIRSEPGSLTNAELSESYLANRQFHVFDLARLATVVQNKTFENCSFYGPAFVALAEGNVLDHTGFSLPLEEHQEALFIEVPNGTGFMAQSFSNIAPSETVTF
jgi:hypothetical protein